MSITKERKKESISEYALTQSDTGSPEIQIALLSERINNLSAHMKMHKKDFHSRQGLLIMVGQRRRLLNYVKKEAMDRYQSIIKRLGLRH